MQKEWNTRLNEASSTEDVLWVVRDFLSRWTPEQLGHIPIECVPGRVNDADGVALYALMLVQKQLGSEPYTSPQLHKMANFFVAASSRISQILARAAQDAAIARARV